MGEYSNNGDITDDQRDAIILAGAFQAASVRTFYYPGRSDIRAVLGVKVFFCVSPICIVFCLVLDSHHVHLFETLSLFYYYYDYYSFTL